MVVLYIWTTHKLNYASKLCTLFWSVIPTPIYVVLTCRTNVIMHLGHLIIKIKIVSDMLMTQIGFMMKNLKRNGQNSMFMVQQPKKHSV